ncbi:hypothetical protein niasHT_011613 [Heterodera trifolii]|uniref:Uncharacterized protein n=1 Tax=Heterodera trifolii TaxID=157864 RepID=A0ABD2LH36_9BILA
MLYVPRFQLIGIVTVRELRQTDNNALYLEKTKKLFFPRNISRGRNFYIYVLHGEQVLYSVQTEYNRQEKTNYLEIDRINWINSKGTDVITFQRDQGVVMGSATVELLCENSAVFIDFLQGVRHYYRDANGGLFFYDANAVLYFVGANDDLYSVDANGYYHLVSQP